ncbi:hypothetical protein BGZ99_000506 [Dissophora globulifera]|uniref:Velvet domain-containing protein n=1 Tax=Dissophora globulifera TaxID=979702 RepID=A0A9P6RYU8_9FUNG|nr:hypothetical protein BGZ99_000506 [Dissophora globulifera]
MVRSTSTAPYCFVSGQADRSTASTASKYILTIRQQPVRAKVCGAKERDRRPIDPPPIVQIKLADPSSDRNKDYLQSPYLFMCCNLVQANDSSGEIVAPAHRALAGTVVSSLNRLKDVDNSDGGFFVFGDMSVRVEGHFRLRFTLFELAEGQVVHVMSTVSSPMTVHSSKTFPGMSESTFLSRSFSDQGVRIRIRKDHHVKPKRALSTEIPEDPLEAATSMHSPPSSCHEADHSGSESMYRLAQPSKRARSSSINGNRRHVAVNSRHPKLADSRGSSAEPLERTPPSSPGSYMEQDPAPMRPRHHPYMPEDPLRRYDDHRLSWSSRYKDGHHPRAGRSEEHPPESRSSRRQGYAPYPRVVYDPHYHPSQAEDIPRRSSHGYYHPSIYSDHKERISRSHEHTRQYSSSPSSNPSRRHRHHRHPTRPLPLLSPPSRHHHSPPQEHGPPYLEEYPEGYSEEYPEDYPEEYPEEYSPSYHGHSPSHPLGAAQSFPSNVHSSRYRHHYPYVTPHPHHPPRHAASAPVHPHAHPSSMPHVPGGPHRKPREPSSRHGFPAALLNDEEMEYSPIPPNHYHQHAAPPPPPTSSHHVQAHLNQSHRNHRRDRKESRHSRTPSMSSQHSEGNFSPPHPFSPPESHVPTVATATAATASTAATPSTPGGGGLVAHRPMSYRRETPPMYEDMRSQMPTSPHGVKGGPLGRSVFAPHPSTSMTSASSVASTPPSLSSRSPTTAVNSGGVRIQLPPIHNLSTRSPTPPIGHALMDAVATAPTSGGYYIQRVQALP